ncbi:hypothetical protein I8752_26200 [Nostocaceae cyanobacterium CENA369]|uniref:Uncharacterized protein n=1 Tax=Dendronalium phyllosphericum CENA369 TaxID=1725256 RepID=A0A8J7LHR0_9NOST|nr:hypothetical protein [Dendronalium phyllosphericum]MBH8576418.1 hypothetical protein [Dendronalium phyllosphericum CENA369]
MKTTIDNSYLVMLNGSHSWGTTATSSQSTALLPRRKMVFLLNTFWINKSIAQKIRMGFGKCLHPDRF